MIFGELEDGVVRSGLEDNGMEILDTESRVMRVRPNKTVSVSVAAKRQLKKQNIRKGQSGTEAVGMTSSFKLGPGRGHGRGYGRGLSVGVGDGLKEGNGVHRDDEGAPRVGGRGEGVVEGELSDAMGRWSPSGLDRCHASGFESEAA